MKQVLVLLLSTLAISLGWDAGLRVRFSNTGPDADYYIGLPMTLPEAQSQDWTKEERVDKVLPSLVMYCHPTFIICLLYDDTQYVAGIQVALPETEFKDSVWDWDELGYIKWTDTNGKNYWTKQQYFVNEAYLATSAQKRVANRDPSSLLSAGGSVWVSGNRAELFEVTKQPDHMLANGFIKQGCIPGMGLHYFPVTNTTACDAVLFPWFTLYEQSGTLFSSGLIIPGKIDPNDLQKDWYERLTKTGLQMAIPNAPSCLYDLADSPGFIAFHIWYVSEPWTFRCST